jgi:hypothetical protein
MWRDRLHNFVRHLRGVAASPPGDEHAVRAEPAAVPGDPRKLYWEAGRLLDAGEFDAAEAMFLQYASVSLTRAADGYAGAGRAVWRLRGKREITGAAEAEALPPEARVRAIEHYRRALAADPDHARSMEGLAILLGPSHGERLPLLRRAAERSDAADVFLVLGDDLVRTHRTRRR